LGKLKMVHEIKEAVFLAPKSYWLNLKNGEKLTVTKGLKMSLTNEEILMAYKEHIIRKTEVRNFWVDLKNFQILVKKRDIDITNIFYKREKIYNSDGNWIDTKPREIYFK
jgi:hypothetical protein